MALTDVFAVQYLVQETEAPVGGVRWSEIEGGGHEAEVNGVRLHLTQSHTRAGAFVSLALRVGPDKVYIAEPQSTAVFGRKYKDDDQRQLADLLRKLEQSVIEQCERARRRAAEQSDEIRQKVLRQLVFGVESNITTRS